MEKSIDGYSGFLFCDDNEVGNESQDIAVPYEAFGYIGHDECVLYTHIGFDDAEEELKRMEEFRKAQAEIEQKKEKPMSQKMFKAI